MAAMAQEDPFDIDIGDEDEDEDDIDQDEDDEDDEEEGGWQVGDARAAGLTLYG
jgi:hypothetical protein